MDAAQKVTNFAFLNRHVQMSQTCQINVKSKFLRLQKNGWKYFKNVVFSGQQKKCITIDLKNLNQ